MDAIEENRVSQSELGQLLSYIVAHVAQSLCDNKHVVNQPTLGIYLEGPKVR